jgi:hypothetical protein
MITFDYQMLIKVCHFIYCNITDGMTYMINIENAED